MREKYDPKTLGKLSSFVPFFLSSGLLCLSGMFQVSEACVVYFLVACVSAYTKGVDNVRE